MISSTPLAAAPADSGELAGGEIPAGLSSWLDLNRRQTRDTWVPIAARWMHFCPFVSAFVDEYSDLIVQCRCHTGQEFFTAQDRRAVDIDSRRS